MKKLLFVIMTLVLFVACRNQETIFEAQTFTSTDSVSVDQNVLKNITVYGDIHTIASDVEPNEDVQKTQQWLCEIVTEPIVVVEGIPAGDSVTVPYLIAVMKRDVPGISDDKVIEGINFMKDYHMSYVATFVVNNSKCMFGGENDSLYQAINLLVENKNSLENINLRSKAICLNAIKVAEKYPDQKIAIVIGRRHLAWFDYNGFKTVDPKENIDF